MFVVAGSALCNRVFERCAHEQNATEVHRNMDRRPEK
jgi:hypothetical protein